MSNPNEKIASIRAKLKFPSLTSFVEKYAPNVSTAGIFVKTAAPKPVGTRVKFEFLIGDGSVVMRGLGQVAWVRETDADDRPVGMGIKFVKLDAASRKVLDRIIDFKHALGGPPKHSRYSEVPPPYVPEGTDVEEEETVEPPPPQPSEKEIVSPAPSPAAAEPPRAEAAPRKRHRPRTASVDLSAIDSMLADIAAPPVDTARKRRKIGEHDAIAPQPVHAPVAPAAVPAPPAAAPRIEEPAPPAAAPKEAAELDLESALQETRANEEEAREELRDELEALEGPPPVVLREPATGAARAAGAGRDPVADDLQSGDLIDLLEPEQAASQVMSPSGTPRPAGAADSVAPIGFTPGSTVSFMPQTSETDSLAADFESVLGGAGEVSAPIAALDEENGITELGEDAVIEGGADHVSFDEQGDFEILAGDEAGAAVAAGAGQGDMVDDLMAEMARSSQGPEEPAELQLLEEEAVGDALDDIFDEGQAEVPAAHGPSMAAPETLPDDAVPPGLVRERPVRRGAPPPPPEPAADAASKKKGFFGKLFGK